MNDIQERTNRWLSRMDDYEVELQMLYKRRDDIIASMSGISKYDSKAIRGGSDQNITESRNIEYSMICEKIERIEAKISKENARTLAVIDQVKGSKLRGMLTARYINHINWEKAGYLYGYAKSSAFRYMQKCLNAAAPFIPKEIVSDENKFKSLTNWTISD